MTSNLSLLLAAVLAQTPELVSPLGQPLHARADTAGVIAKAESAAARAPSDVDSLVRLGHAYAAVWRYGDAIAAYDRAIARAPGRAVLYRHRGHRYISTRQVAKAVQDLERGAALDSTSWDIWYHLGLAYYLSERWDDAARAYGRCLAIGDSAESRVAATDWLWMTLSRGGRRAEAAALLAALPDTLAVRENIAYYRRLLFYGGKRTEADLEALMTRGDLEFATVGYGLANWRLVQGDTARADEVFRRIVAGPYWPAFGFIAAEAELARRR